MQALIYSKMHPQDVEAKLRGAMVHLKFAMDLCKVQVVVGRKLMFEHPVNASSRHLDMVTDLLRLNNVVTIDFDFC